MNPKERAKEIWHKFYKEKHHNFFTAKSDTLTLVDTYIQESRFGNHLKAVTFWEKVKQEVEAL